MDRRNGHHGSQSDAEKFQPDSLTDIRKAEFPQRIVFRQLFQKKNGSFSDSVQGKLMQGKKTTYL